MQIGVCVKLACFAMLLIKHLKTHDCTKLSLHWIYAKMNPTRCETHVIFQVLKRAQISLQKSLYSMTCGFGITWLQDKYLRITNQRLVFRDSF